MFRNPYQHPSTVQPSATEASASPSEATSPPPGLFPWQTAREAQADVQEHLDHGHHSEHAPLGPPPPVWHTPPPYVPTEDERLAAMERNEPKRRLIRDAKLLGKIRGLTQAQMAEEIGVPHRTLEDWLQFRRTPKAPGTTLLHRWMKKYRE